MNADELFELSVFVRDDHAIHSVNGTPVVDCYDAGVYSAGGIGIQANYSVLKVDDIKVTYLKSALEGGVPGYTVIAQPDLGVIGGYALSEYVADQAALDRVTGAEIKPANAIFFVNSELKLTDKDGKNPFSDLKTALGALGGAIMPTLYVKDEETVTAVLRQSPEKSAPSAPHAPSARPLASAALSSAAISCDPSRLQKPVRYLLKSSGFFIAGISKGLLPKDVIIYCLPLIPRIVCYCPSLPAVPAAQSLPVAVSQRGSTSESPVS